MVATMRDAYKREGIRSMIVFPLLIRGARSGTMVFYSRRRREFRDVDVQVGAALANLAAAALTTAELYEEQRQAREAADHARQQAAFLAEVSDRAQRVARLRSDAEVGGEAGRADDRRLVRRGHRRTNDGAVQRLAVAHVDPEKVELARALRGTVPAGSQCAGGRARGDPDGPTGVHVPRFRPSCSTARRGTTSICAFCGRCSSRPTCACR